jgi:hypothetical protein
MRSLLGSVGCREALMTEPLHSSEMAPRLLSRETAATYSGMSPIRSGKHPPSMSRRVRTAKRNLWTSKPWTHGLINNPGLAHAPARLPSGPGCRGMIVQVQDIRRARSMGRVFYHDRPRRVAPLYGRPPFFEGVEQQTRGAHRSMLSARSSTAKCPAGRAPRNVADRPDPQAIALVSRSGMHRLRKSGSSYAGRHVVTRRFSDRLLT